MSQAHAGTYVNVRHKITLHTLRHHSNALTECIRKDRFIQIIQVLYRFYTGFIQVLQVLQVLYRFHAVMTDRTDPCLQKCTPLRYACTSDSPESIAGFYLMAAARTGNTLFLAAFCPYFRKEIGSIMLSGLKIIYTNV